MFSKRFTDNVKSGFQRTKDLVRQGVENFPKVVKKTIEFSNKVRKGANEAKRIADKVQPIYEANKGFIDNQEVKRGIEKGFGTANKVVDRINKVDSVVSQVGNAILS